MKTDIEIFKQTPLFHNINENVTLNFLNYEEWKEKIEK